MPKVSPRLKDQVKKAYLTGLCDSVQELAAKFDLNPMTVYRWARIEGWKDNIRSKVMSKLETRKQNDLKIIPQYEPPTAEELTEEISDEAVAWVQRHAKIGAELAEKGKAILDSKPIEKITTNQAIKLAETGTDIERKAMTLGKEDRPNVNIVTVVDLWSLINKEM